MSQFNVYREYFSESFCGNTYYNLTSLDYKQKCQEGWTALSHVYHESFPLGQALGKFLGSVTLEGVVMALIWHYHQNGASEPVPGPCGGKLGRHNFPPGQTNTLEQYKDCYLLAASSELPQVPWNLCLTSQSSLSFICRIWAVRSLPFFTLSPRECRHSLPLESSYWVNKAPLALNKDLSW